MIFNKKGLSAVVVVVLFLLVAIISVIGFGNWYSSFQTNLQSDMEIENDGVLTNFLVIDRIVGDKLYLVNKAEVNKTIQGIFVNGVDCRIYDENIFNIKSFNISSCLLEFSDEDVELVVQTNKGIFKKQVYIDKK